jgi:hypothetical protein
MECSEQSTQEYDTKLATRKVRWILIFAIFLGLVELGVWSYKHQQKQKHSAQIASSSVITNKSDLLVNLSSDEIHNSQFKAYHYLQEVV